MNFKALTDKRWCTAATKVAPKILGILRGRLILHREVDGTVFIPAELPVGEFAEVTVREWCGYDLVAG